MDIMSAKKPTKEKNKKDYQFTVRIPTRMKNTALKRLEQIGLNTMSEYIRHLVLNDIDGLEDYYGQAKS